MIIIINRQEGEPNPDEMVLLLILFQAGKIMVNFVNERYAFNTF